MSKLTQHAVLAELVALVVSVRESQQQEQALVVEAEKHLESVKARGLDKHLVQFLESSLSLHKAREKLGASIFSWPSFLIVEEGLHRVNTLVQAGQDVDDAIGQALVDMNLADPGEGLDLPTLDEVHGDPVNTDPATSTTAAPAFVSEHLPGAVDAAAQAEATATTQGA